MSWPNEDLVLAYNSEVGSTHLIEPIAETIIKLLETKSNTLEELTLACESYFSSVDALAAREYIGSTLLQLHAANLIRAVPA